MRRVCPENRLESQNVAAVSFIFLLGLARLFHHRLSAKRFKKTSKRFGGNSVGHFIENYTGALPIPDLSCKTFD